MSRRIVGILYDYEVHPYSDEEFITIKSKMVNSTRTIGRGYWIVTCVLGILVAGLSCPLFFYVAWFAGSIVMVLLGVGLAAIVGLQVRLLVWSLQAR